MAVRLRSRITGAGRPLLIQGPAWGPSSDYLRLTLAPLLDGVQVITYDPRNTGGSPRVEAPDAQAVEHLVDDLEGLRRGATWASRRAGRRGPGFVCGRPVTT